jgi:hypothetical protein
VGVVLFQDAFNRVWPSSLNVINGLRAANAAPSASASASPSSSSSLPVSGGDGDGRNNSDDGDGLGTGGGGFRGAYVAGGFALSSNRGLRDQLPMVQLVVNGARGGSAGDDDGVRACVRARARACVRACASCEKCATYVDGVT